MLEILILVILAVWLVYAVRKIHRDRKAGLCVGCGACRNRIPCSDLPCKRKEYVNDRSDK